jgi:hypothetical protein
LFKTAGTDQAHPEVSKTTKSEVSEQDAEEKQDTGSSKIRDVFTGDALETALLSVDSGAEAEKNGDLRVVSGGANVLNTDPVDILGETTTVSGDVETWVRSEARFDAESDWVAFEPHSQEHVTMELVKQTDGTWMVSSLSWKYLPGFAP